MKVGDMVKFRRRIITLGRVGVVTGFEDRKCWRTEDRGKKINWDIVDPESHAIVLFDNGTSRIPVVDLEVINEDH